MEYLASSFYPSDSLEINPGWLVLITPTLRSNAHIYAQANLRVVLWDSLWWLQDSRLWFWLKKKEKEKRQTHQRWFCLRAATLTPKVAVLVPDLGFWKTCPYTYSLICPPVQLHLLHSSPSPSPLRPLQIIPQASQSKSLLLKASAKLGSISSS